MDMALLSAPMDITGTLPMLVLLMDTMARSGLAAVSLSERARGTDMAVSIMGATIGTMIGTTDGIAIVGMDVAMPMATIGTTTGMTAAGVIMTTSAAETVGMAEGSFVN